MPFVANRHLSNETVAFRFGSKQTSEMLDAACRSTLHQEHFLQAMSNKSLDASGGSVFLNLLGAAKGALIRAAASTPTFGILFTKRRLLCDRETHSESASF